MDFPGMTPELRAYLDFKPEGEAGYAEEKRLLGLVQPGLVETYNQSQTDQFCIPENEVVKDRKEKLSPSGKYRLNLSWYRTAAHTWAYSQGRVFRVGSDVPIATINRNIGSFPFTWIENHPNGHVYFIGGSTYQGQTVIELDTGKRLDVLSEGTEQGWGFCWGDYTFHAATQMLVVCGCHWACPYEFRFYDFSDPMAGWPEIKPLEVRIDEDQQYPTIEPDGRIRCYQTKSVGGESDLESKERIIQSITTWQREGLLLTLVDEWVSEGEKKARADQAEAERTREAWKASFQANDPLYLAYQKLVLDPAFKPESHHGIGITHEGWCPTFQVKETRWCRRINTVKGRIVDLEWACLTGPIKVESYPDGKGMSKFFEHTVTGMQEAFAYAKGLLMT